jgi:DNA-binding NtrC family response regulator
MNTTVMSHSKPTILLVDDQHSIRHILSAGLKANGFEVLTAASGEKALAFCEGFEGPIDLLLSDISLTPQELWPENGMEEFVSHGVAVVERALKVRPSLKVALFTGHSDQHLMRLGLRTEGFVLLRKPCSLSTLVDVCRQLLNVPNAGKSPEQAVNTV